MVVIVYDTVLTEMLFACLIGRFIVFETGYVCVFGLDEHMMRRIVSVAVWVIVFSAAFCFGASPAEKRQTICLDGTWEVAEGKMDVRPKAFDHTVPVPGLLDMAKPAFDTPGNVISDAERGAPWERHKKSDPLREAFWYRRTFEVNAPKSTVAMLKVNKAFFGMCVFVNGHKAGTHTFNFTPGWFDVGQYLKTDGTENELVIRVGSSLAAIPLSATDGWDYEKTRYVPGIYDSVSLIVTSTPHVVNVQTVPDLKGRSVRVVIELANSGTSVVAPEVKAVVREVRSGRVRGEAVVKATSFRPITIAETTTLRPGGKGRVDMTVEIADPHCWTPEDPFLYELIVDTGADTYKTRFAMRTFETDPASGRVLLNGKPYYMRGSNVCIFRFSEDPKRGDKMWDRKWVRKLHRQFKSMHWNTLRYCIGFPPEMWYEIADEEGLLIQDEFPIWYNHWPHGTMHGWPDQITADSLAKEFRQWMRERWNHPCVVIWDAQNESSNDTVLAEVIGRVRGLDLSNRPWDNGWGSTQSPTDVSEYHPYRCSPQFPRPFSLSIFEQESGMPDTGPKQGGHPPYIINEYGWLWLNRDGTPTIISRPVYDSILGADATVEEYRNYYARTLAAMTEFWRSRRKCAGVLHFCGLGHWRPNGITCDNFADLESLAFEANFYKYVRDSFAPVGVVIDLWKEQVEPSTLLPVPVMVVNDLEAPFGGKVTLRIERDGKTIWKQTKPATAKPFGTNTTQFQVQFPNKPGRCELIAEIRGHDNQPVRSWRLLDVRVSGEARGGLLRNGGLESGLTGTDKARMIIFEPLDEESGSAVGPGGRMDHWTTWGPGVLYYSEFGLTIESRAVKFWHSDSGMFQDFDATAGKDYAFSVEVLNSTVRKETLKLWKGYLRAEFYDDSSALVSSTDLDAYDPTTTATPLDQWETLSGTIKAPAGATKGRIVLGLKDYKPGVGGALHFDNARVAACQE